MIWLHVHPLSPPVSKRNRRYTGRLKKRDYSLTGEGRGYDRKKATLYRLFKTLWARTIRKQCVFTKITEENKEQIQLKV
jgi:hypothetical protein